jgi:hypothetical protein
MPRVFEALPKEFLQRLDSHAVLQPSQSKRVKKSCHDGAKAEKSTNQATVEPCDAFCVDNISSEDLNSVAV